MPFDPFPDLPLYTTGDGCFLVDDSAVDYPTPDPEALAAALTRLLAAPANVFPSPPLRGGQGPLDYSPDPPPGCGDGSSAPYLVNFTNTMESNLTVTVYFQVAGGSNGIAYHLYRATNSVPGAVTNAGWEWQRFVYACDTVTLTNQPLAGAFYLLGPEKDSDGDGMPDWWEVTNGLNPNDPADADDDPDGDWVTNLHEYQNGTNPHDLQVLAWGASGSGQCKVPVDLRNVAGLAGGWGFSAVLKTNGTIAAWGDSGYGLTNGALGLTNATGIGARCWQAAAVAANGRVISWGATNGAPPANLTNAVGVAVGYDHLLALRSDGYVAAWGNNSYGKCEVPALTNARAIAAGFMHSVALLSNGTVVAWGWNASSPGWNLTNVPPGASNVTAIAAGAYHTLALRADGTVVAWGAGGPTNQSGDLNGAERGQSIVPAELSNVVAIAAGIFHSLALRGDGTVVTWGAVDAFPYPEVQGHLAAIASGDGHALALRSGRLTPIMAVRPVSQTASAGSSVLFTSLGLGLAGVRYQWQFDGVNLPGETNATLSRSSVQWADAGDYRVIIATGAGAVTSPVATLTVLDPTQFLPGAVAAWGANDWDQSHVRTDETNTIALAAGDSHSVAVREDGSVIQWGYPWANVPSDLTNAVAVAAGYDHTLALRDNGTVVAWGDPESPANDVPGDLAGVRAIAAGWNHNVALLTNGQVRAWGLNGANLGWHLTEVPANLTNATAIAAGAMHSLALRSDGTVAAWGTGRVNTGIGFDWGQALVPETLSNVVAIAAGGLHSLALRGDGTVVAWGQNAEGQCTVPAGLSNVMAIAAGNAHSVALRNDGTVVAWGRNTCGQTNVPVYLAGVKLIAAGGDHTLAAVFSPLVQYPVDVSKDLLLIYNTNSLDSRFVKDYYLAHRPMVSDANVLGIDCPATETIYPWDFTHTIQAQLCSWLTINPTKRPQYVVLFLGMPSRVNGYGTNTYYATNIFPSVSFQLHSAVTGWQPFVTHLNMGGTNDCRAYIDKLAWCGSNYSPGQVILSASKGGYGNINFALDGVRHGGPVPYLETYDYAWATVANATNGLLAAGIAPNAILIVDGLETCVQCATNIFDGQTNYSCAQISSPPHLTNAVNVAGYVSWGFHSLLGNNYAVTASCNAVKWGGDSRWWIIETIESNNGKRNSDSGNFMQWFSSNAFGGTNYSNTPVGAVTYVDEPGLDGVNSSSVYFGLWAGGKNFAMSAWNSRGISIICQPALQAVGDPLISK